MIFAEVVSMLAFVAAALMFFYIYKRYKREQAAIALKHDRLHQAFKSNDYRELDMWLALYSESSSKTLVNLVEERRNELFLEENDSE